MQCISPWVWDVLCVLAERNNLCPGGPGFRPNLVTLVLEGNFSPLSSPLCVCLCVSMCFTCALSVCVFLSVSVCICVFHMCFDVCLFTLYVCVCCVCVSYIFDVCVGGEGGGSGEEQAQSSIY